MLQVLNAARGAKLRVFYAIHHRYRPGDYETWKDIAPVQKAAWTNKTFEFGTWGGETHPGFERKPVEIVATHASELGGHQVGYSGRWKSPICKLPCPEVSLNAKLICQST
jgi:hypothetical protein